MTQRYLTRSLWIGAVVFGLLTVTGCQETADESAPIEAAQPAEKTAQAAPEKAPEKPEASAAAPASPPRTVRSPKVTAPVEEIPFKGKRIAIVHTANVIGELEPCG
ncbi:MAG: hypothetical protein CL940_04695 [Deltaproteobacteria bacterium]|nr:hypothetical protein [Deltaproteobacteria bacterium]